MLLYFYTRNKFFLVSKTRVSIMYNRREYAWDDRWCSFWYQYAWLTFTWKEHLICFVPETWCIFWPFVIIQESDNILPVHILQFLTALLFSYIIQKLHCFGVFEILLSFQLIELRWNLLHPFKKFLRNAVIDQL